MSAICGLYNRDDKPATSHVIEPVMQALAAFGPDGEQTWARGSVALGQQMRQVTLESQREVLPWHDEAARLTITADARLDNREELCAQLHIPYPERLLMSDSQLLLRAYQQWGADCPARLLGDFAFAIWDDREQRLFCARDILGCKPFYYQVAAQQMVFATTLQAVLAVPGAPRQIDESVVAARLLRRFVPLDRTPYAAIYRLPPAHAIIINSAEVQTWAYWQPDQVPEVRFPSEAVYMEQLVELFQQAVRCRLRSASPIGTHLSGGLDSSGITVLAARELRATGQTATAFSWSPPPVVDAIPGDERVLIQAICDQEDIVCQFAILTPASVAAWARHTLRPFDQPATEFVHEQIIRQRVHAQGIRVLLSGWGGDELLAFNGRGFFADLFRRGHWVRLWRELHLGANLHNRSVAGRIKGEVILPLLPDWALPWLPAHRLPRSITRRPDLPTLLHPDYAARLRAADSLPPSRLRERPGVRTNQLALLANGHLTERIEGWATEAPQYQLDYRYPLLDRRVVEFSLGLPPQMFFQHGWKRYLYRQAVTGILPPQVQWCKTKNDPARYADHQAVTRALHDQIVCPLLADLLADGRDFHCLDAARVRRVVQALPQDPDALRALKVIPALRVELMLNPDLAQAVQAHLAGTGKGGL